MRYRKEETEVKEKQNKALVRSQERTDYRIQPSSVLDAAAVIISAVIAFIIWVYN